jgi:hypothetical protein
MKFREAVTHLITEGVRAVTPPVEEWKHRATLDGKPVPSIITAIFGDLFAEFAPGRRGSMYEIDVQDVNVKLLTVLLAATIASAQQLGISLQEFNAIVLRSWSDADPRALSRLFVAAFQRAAGQIEAAFRASKTAPAPAESSPVLSKLEAALQNVDAAREASNSTETRERGLQGARRMLAEVISIVRADYPSMVASAPINVELTRVIKERDQALSLVRKYAAGSRYHWAPEEQKLVADICAMAPGAPISPGAQEWKSHADCKSPEDCERRFPRTPEKDGAQ